MAGHSRSKDGVLSERPCPGHPAQGDTTSPSGVTGTSPVTADLKKTLLVARRESALSLFARRRAGTLLNAHAARLDRSGPFRDLALDERAEIFRAAPIRRDDGRAE